MKTARFYARSWLLMMLGLVAGFGVNCHAEEMSAGDPAVLAIVEKADRIRFPAEGFQVDVSIVTLLADKSSESRRYRVLSKGNESSVVMVTEPAAERGQIMLMKGRDLWVFMPEVSQPIRLSFAQRLTGQVANGDLARANFAGDYFPRMAGNESINGREYHVLDLKAVDRGVTYQRVKYWVDKENARPLKAEFYSLSNRLLKRCSYENYRAMAGSERPTRLVMEDALKAGERSVLEYGEMKLRDLPDKIFTKEYLKKLD
jgi:outer membrane lipoprotein-sorting protein